MLQYKIPFLYLTFICWINISKIYLTMILISFYSYGILPLFLYHGNTDGNCSLCKYWNMNQIEFLSHFFSCIFVIVLNLKIVELLYRKNHGHQIWFVNNYKIYELHLFFQRFILFKLRKTLFSFPFGKSMLLHQLTVNLLFRMNHSMKEHHFWHREMVEWKFILFFIRI